MKSYKIFSGTAHPRFAVDVAKNLEVLLSSAEIARFSDGEISVRISESVRGYDVFVIQPTCAPANDSLMELLIIADAMKRSSAASITAVIPYFGYARQDRKAAPRVPISAKLVADLLQSAGVNRVVTMDLHAGQIQGFFDIPVDNLYGSIVFKEYVERLNLVNPIVASPDIGGVARARYFAKLLNLDLAIIDKRRQKANESEVMNIIGDVQGKSVILLDDMIDTAGTMLKAAEALKAQGACAVLAFGTHAVFSGTARERIESPAIDNVVVTDTIPIHNPHKKITILSVASLFAEVIRRIYRNESVHSLFD